MTPEARILIVDDDPALLEALPEAVHLRIGPVDVDTCESGAIAVERIHASDYDAIVTDIKMPGMDGVALLSVIRETRPTTPTLLITGHGEDDLRRRAMEGGAYEYILKPIDRDSFITSLRRAIQTRANARGAQDIVAGRHIPIEPAPTSSTPIPRGRRRVRV